MKWLLDTHVAIWFAADPNRLRREVVDAVQDPGAQILISVASWWELAIEHAIGRPRQPPAGAASELVAWLYDGAGAGHRSGARLDGDFACRGAPAARPP
ncbi:hypothetical protein WMF27_01205 [Sorangium sp. So ce281]|uniref:hypothetical protein n=1 Tax=unclassified Sorangium TaxID=2621164 RepID=UPI003F608478